MVSALREWMAEIGERAQVAVSSIGKWKTAAQMLALIILLANPPAFNAWVIGGYALLILSAVLTLWSMTNIYLPPNRIYTPTNKKINFFNQGLD